MWRFSMQVNNSSWQSKKLAQISLNKEVTFHPAGLYECSVPDLNPPTYF
jgi:hypothetical protein